MHPLPDAPSKRLGARALSLALMAGLLAGCLGAPPASVAEDVVERGTNGRAVVRVAGRVVKLVVPPGVSAAGLAVMIGGQVYRPDASGRLNIPETALTAAKRRGGFAVLAPGFAPRRVAFDGTEDEIALRPAEPAGTSRTPSAGVARGNAVATTFGAGVLPEAAGGGTAVSLAYYAPPGQAQEAARKVRDALGGGPCDAPLPCPPTVAAVGLLVTVDGPLRPGTIVVAFDLDGWRRGWDGKAPPPWEAEPGVWSEAERARALAAARILEVFARIDAAGAAGIREALARDHGIRLAGSSLMVDVAVGAEAALEGLARVEVWSLAALGVDLEVTVVSAARGALPDAFAGGGPVAGLAGGLTGAAGGVPLVPGGTAPIVPAGGLIGKTKEPGSLLPGVGGGIISNNGSGVLCKAGGVILAAGGGIISDHGGAIINAPPAAGVIAGLADNGGRIEGTVRGPASLAKLRLASLFPEVPYVGAQVTLPYVEGAPVATTDGEGRFVLENLPPTAPYVLVACQFDGNTLLTICPAPRAAGQVVQAPLNPDTTPVAAQALLWLADGCALPGEFDPAGFDAAVARVGASLQLGDHYDVQGRLYEPTDDVGAFTLARMGTTFVTRKLAIGTDADVWRPLVTVAAGQRVSFWIGGTTNNGEYDSDYRGNAFDSGWGAVRIRGAGIGDRIYPHGETLVAPAGGTIEYYYFDRPGWYWDNSGAYDARVFVDRCD